MPPSSLRLLVRAWAQQHAAHTQAHTRTRKALQSAWRYHLLSHEAASSSHSWVAAVAVAVKDVVTSRTHAVAEWLGFGGSRSMPPPAHAIADGACGDTVCDEHVHDDALEWDGRVYLHAPKKRRSHMRVRLRWTGKYLEPKNVLDCPVCGAPKLPHRLCKPCYERVKEESREFIAEKVALARKNYKEP